MKRLPTEIWCKILNNLNVNDLLKCRLINSKFNSIIKNHMKIETIHINASSKLFYKQYYDFTYEPIESNQYFYAKNLNLLNCSFKQILKNLKKLSIYSWYYFKFNSSLFSLFNLINQFTHLEYLQIDFRTSERNGTFNLPNLKYLSIHSHSFEPIKLNTPKLKAVKFACYFEKLDFIFPDSITHLCTMEYEPNVIKFKNLERYDLNYLDSSTTGKSVPGNLENI